MGHGWTLSGKNFRHFQSGKCRACSLSKRFNRACIFEIFWPPSPLKYYSFLNYPLTWHTQATRWTPCNVNIWSLGLSLTHLSYYSSWNNIFGFMEIGFIKNTSILGLIIVNFFIIGKIYFTWCVLDRGYLELKNYVRKTVWYHVRRISLWYIKPPEYQIGWEFGTFNINIQVCFLIEALTWEVWEQHHLYLTWDKFEELKDF